MTSSELAALSPSCAGRSTDILPSRDSSSSDPYSAITSSALSPTDAYTTLTVPAAGALSVAVVFAFCSDCRDASRSAIASCTSATATRTDVLSTFATTCPFSTVSPFLTETADSSTLAGSVNSTLSCSTRYPAAISEEEMVSVSTVPVRTSASATASSDSVVFSAGNRTTTRTSAPKSSRTAGHTACFLCAGMESSPCSSASLRSFLLLIPRKISRTIQPIIPTTAPIPIQSQYGRTAFAAVHTFSGIHSGISS